VHLNGFFELLRQSYPKATYTYHSGLKTFTVFLHHRHDSTKLTLYARPNGVLLTEGYRKRVEGRCDETPECEEPHTDKTPCALGGTLKRTHLLDEQFVLHHTGKFFSLFNDGEVFTSLVIHNVSTETRKENVYGLIKKYRSALRYTTIGTRQCDNFFPVHAVGKFMCSLKQLQFTQWCQK
jgi:hypothetical protein